MIASRSYIARRGELETYFDRTAADAWSRLTSDAPVSGIRATVRAGRTEMRNTLLSWLPRDLEGRRVLDAGCGTGALAIEAARAGANVTAIDLSPTMIGIARERSPKHFERGSLHFASGDMLDAANGRFDHIVAMDALIHYALPDMVAAVGTLAASADRSVMFTFAPRTKMLTAMHAVGRMLPRGDRAPAIEPAAEHKLIAAIEASPRLQDWKVGRQHRVAVGFYISSAMELVRR
jgi:magnesium-protoporphyrin O-methyltransferase